ncbi:MAG: hypothetical protein PHE73_07810 [Sulfurovaceae bacterium]|nr:hypothetical protein [Sulfurovaceae bacterium]
MLIIISLLFFSLAIWAATAINQSSPASNLPIVENANDLCYEQPTETGLCILGICLFHTQTISIRNLSIDNLTDMTAVIDLSGLNVGVLRGCGIDNVSGNCNEQSLIDLGGILGVLDRGIVYQPMPNYGPNGLHSIYNASLLSVNIFSGQNLYGVYTKNGQQYRGQIGPCATTPFPIFGNFNVERNTPDYTNGDYRLYTQVTGRPFNLRAVFYKQDYITKTAFDGDVAIELVDAGNINETSYNTTNCRSFKSVDVNQTVYLNNQASGATFSLTPNKAIKNAAMRVWAFKYKDDNSIVEYHCTPASCYKSIYTQYYKKYGDTTCANFCKTTNSERQCYACLAGNYARATCSRDNFAIRPDGLRLRVGDNNQGANLTKKWITGNQNNPTIKNLVSGYNYPIEINATRYNSNALADGYYNINANETIIPNSDLSLIKSTGNLLAIAFNDNINTCNDTTHRQLRTSVLISGTNSARDMLYRDNIGNYNVWMIDNAWTRVDWDTSIKPRFAGFQNLIDCITGSSDSENYKVGCATSSDKGTANFSNIPIRFEPYGINVSSMVLGHLPRNGASDWLYMSDLKQTPNMAVDLNGSLSAINAKNSVTTNFVNGCAAENINLQLDFNSSGPDVMIAENLNDHTETNVRLGYRIESNSDKSYSFGDVNRSAFIMISKTKFLKDNNGTSNLQILYNIPKILDKVLNPIRIFYKALKAMLINDSGTEINALANMKNDFHPEGNVTYNQTYTFLYGRVYTPFEKNTPSVLTLNTKATMYALAYCDQNCTQYSTLIGTPNNIDTNWYKVNAHLADASGLIQSLSASKTSTTITPHANIKFVNNGATNPVTIGYPMNIRPQLVRITIIPDLWLKYHPDIAQNGNPFFDIKFTTTEYEWAGVGKTGNVIKTRPTPNTNRLSW